ncbi:sugar kinase [Streptomyces sp. NPDC050738]|uniref:sugar kinase n=1 Tax=Streptomyces sp. NPDC050738 TaxID=3154744 RepID=UPI003434DCB6
MSGTGSGSLVTLGETMAALAPHRIGPLRHATTMGLAVAGSESTVAIGVRRLGHRAAWIGRVGDDELGALVTSTLRGESVDVHATVDAQAPTGLLLKERRTASLRRVHYYRSGSAGSRLAPADLPSGTIESADLLHVTGITPALSATAADTVRAAVARARTAGTAVSYDLNHRARLWTSAEARAFAYPLLPAMSVLFASADEAELLLEVAPGSLTPAELALAIRKLGPQTAVVTLGAEGAVSVGLSGTVHTVPAVPVPEIDPVGAGDSFVAGYLAALLDKAQSYDRLVQAARVAAWSVAAEGDWEGLPSAAELPLTAAPPGTVAR